MLKQRGFSLVEVMLAGALLAGLGFAGAKFMTDQTKQQKGIETKGEINTISADIRSILASETSCNATFKGSKIDTSPTGPGAITQIKQQAFYDPLNPPTPLPPVTVRYEADPNPLSSKTYGSAAVRILDFSLSSADNSTYQTGLSTFMPVPGDPTHKSGSIALLITFYMNKQRAQGQDKTGKMVKLNVEIDNSNTIVSCSAVGSSGTDGRYLQRNSSDDSLRTMEKDLIIADGAGIRMDSDRSLKYDIKPISEAIRNIRKLRPVSYKWKSTHKEVNGVIAQEVQKIYPELVKQNQSGKLSVDYIQLTPILLRGIQQVDQENVKLKSEIRNLKSEQKLMRQELCLKDSSMSFCQEN